MSAYLWLCFPAIIAAVVAAFYIGLIIKKNQVRNTYASLEALLERRYALVSNLMTVTKGYLTQEHELLESLARLRTDAMDGISARDRFRSNDELTKALRQLVQSAEEYPPLRNATNFSQWGAALNESELTVGAARRAFDAAVTEYNDTVASFPTRILAGYLGFRPKQWFELADAQREEPDISAHLSS